LVELVMNVELSTTWVGGASALEEWWASARVLRDQLPWRNERDPWRVLVSEVMLAQTQAGRVAERYADVIAALPTAKDAALRSVGDYLELWAGLGYYRRALSLRESAIAIVSRHGGVVPNDLRSLLALPGVGPYTARAVMAFAFEEPVGVIDTNIGRVLARAVAGRQLARPEAQGIVDELVSGRRPRDFNLALMDLGATLCTSQHPSCAICPINAAGSCAWCQARGDDPARRSAATSRPQARFEGSNRQGRGRLLHAARMGPIAPPEVAAVAGWPDDGERAAAVASQLVDGGLLVRRPDSSLAWPD
jgi:A/G-specific adenine glycosylase